MDFAGQLDKILEQLPEVIRAIGDYSPHILAALVVGAIIRWSIVPLVKAWKDDD